MADERVFLVETKDRVMRVTVPVGFKITYGPLIPMIKDYDGAKAVALRIYRTEKDCVALFRDVLQFREIGALHVDTLAVDNAANESWQEDTDGEFSRRHSRSVSVAGAMSGDKLVYELDKALPF